MVEISISSGIHPDEVLNNAKKCTISFGDGMNDTVEIEKRERKDGKGKFTQYKLHVIDWEGKKKKHKLSFQRKSRRPLHFLWSKYNEMGRKSNPDPHYQQFQRVF